MALPWEELGIAATTDPAAIRRAYAVRLKAMRPDDDPQGFSQLRDAYERALAAALAGERGGGQAGTGVRIDAPPRPAPAPVPPEAMPASAVSPPVAPAYMAPIPTMPVSVAPRPAATEAGAGTALPHPPVPPPDPMAEHLRRGDVLAAAEWLLAARGAGLALAADLAHADRLGRTLAQERALPAEAVRAAAGRLGWPEGSGGTDWGEALRRRLDAEGWLEALRRDAAMRKYGPGAAGPAVARILLGRGSLGAARIMNADRRLRRRYGEYLLHAPVVGDRFDLARMEAIGRMLASRPHPVVERTFERFGLLVLAGMVGWAAGALAAMLDPRLQDGVTGATALVLLLVLLNRRRWPRLSRAFDRWNHP